MGNHIGKPALVLAAALAVGAASIASAPPAAAAACPDNLRPVIRGARAQWDVTCPSPGRVRIQGSVRDTVSGDGRCGRVRVEFRDFNAYTDRACAGQNNPVRFSWTGNGNNVNAYLQVVPA
jgi:hypothetical protein